MAIKKNTREGQFPSHNVSETFDSSPARGLREIVMIEQCALTWPAFGINQKSFEGLILYFYLLSYKI